MAWLQAADGSLINPRHVRRIAQSGKNAFAEFENGDKITLAARDPREVEDALSEVLPAQPGHYVAHVWRAEASPHHPGKVGTTVELLPVAGWRLDGDYTTPIAPGDDPSSRGTARHFMRAIVRPDGSVTDEGGVELAKSVPEFAGIAASVFELDAKKERTNV